MSEIKTVSVAVVGATGYSGAELLRLILMHPGMELVCVTSRQAEGTLLTDNFPRFRGAKKFEGLRFVTPEIDTIAASGAECAFLALPHGVASQFAGPLLEKGLRVIDLSADFRLNDTETYAEYYGDGHPAPELLGEGIYGLPEIKAGPIRDARLVASPGCYPTSVIVPLVPLLRRGLLSLVGISVASMSGTSGAGKSLKTDYLFCEVNESIRAYGAPKHRHVGEIEQELTEAAGQAVRISFVPHLMPVTAGICTTIFADLKEGVSREQIAEAFAQDYGASPFVRILGEGVFPDTKNVTRTNFLDLGWVVDPRLNRLILMSTEDNLGKGASSQAVQSFNLMFDFPEETGLLNY